MDNTLTITGADFWADIIAAHRLEAPPEGAITAIEFAHKIGKSEAHARVILRKYVENGTMQAREFARPEDGKRTTYYWKKGE